MGSSAAPSGTPTCSSATASCSTRRAGPRPRAPRSTSTSSRAAAAAAAAEAARETEEMYERICERLDRLLALPPPLGSGASSEEARADYAEGHETLKLVHELAACVHQGRADLVPPEEEEAFAAASARLVPRAAAALRLSFTAAAPKLEEERGGPSGEEGGLGGSLGGGGLDFRLFSKAAAALLALARLPAVARVAFAEPGPLGRLLEAVALGLADPRLHDRAGPYAHHREKALAAMNKLALEAALGAPRGAALAALLDLLLLCVPAPGYPRVPADDAGRPAAKFSEMACQVLTRLFLKVLKREMAADPGPPFADLDMHQVVGALHAFFERHPPARAPAGAEGKPFLAARNLLWNLGQVLGPEGLAAELDACGVPPGAELRALAREHRAEKQKENVAPPPSSSYASQGQGQEGGPTSPKPAAKKAAAGLTEAHRAELARIVSGISRPENTAAAVEELHRFRRRHPGADVEAEFGGLTATFRKFLARQLDQLEARDRAQEQGLGGGGGGGDAAYGPEGVGAAAAEAEASGSVTDRLRYLKERLRYAPGGVDPSTASEAAPPPPPPSAPASAGNTSGSSGSGSASGFPFLAASAACLL
uniref:Uncharacterized protein n=1 Tax=Heterosigma akashiwo TaxID=2829 RepID=A0A7S3XQ82_HETAK